MAIKPGTVGAKMPIYLEGTMLRRLLFYFECKIKSRVSVGGSKVELSGAIYC